MCCFREVFFVAMPVTASTGEFDCSSSFGSTTFLGASTGGVWAVGGAVSDCVCVVCLVSVAKS